VTAQRCGSVVCAGGDVIVECNRASGTIVVPEAPPPEPLDILRASGRVWLVRRNAVGWWGIVYAADGVTPSVCTHACRSYESAVIDLACRWAGVAEMMRWGLQ
jgi:hypothetical protein